MGDRRSEVGGIVGQEPVRLAPDRRDQHGDVRSVPDESARLHHRLQVRQGHVFRAGQGEQRAVIGQYLLGLGG